MSFRIEVSGLQGYTVPSRVPSRTSIKVSITGSTGLNTGAWQNLTRNILEASSLHNVTENPIRNCYDPYTER